MVLINKGFNLLNKLLNAICAAGMLVLFLMICISVVLRYLFNSSIYGISEVQNIVFVYLTSLGAAAAMSTGEHVGVDFFEKSSTGVRKVLDVFRKLCMIALQIFLIVISVQWIGKVGSYLTPMLEFPQRYAQMAVPVGMALGALACIVLIVLGFRQSTPAKEDKTE